MAPSGGQVSTLVRMNCVMNALEKQEAFLAFKKGLMLDTGCDEESADEVIRGKLFRRKQDFVVEHPLRAHSRQYAKSDLSIDDIVSYCQSIRGDIVKRILAKKMPNKQIKKSTLAPEITRDKQLARIKATGITSGVLNPAITTLYPQLSKSDKLFSNQQIIEILNSVLQRISSPDCKSFKGKNAADGKAECVRKIQEYIADLTPQQPSSSNTDHIEQNTGASSSAPSAGST
jgi:hypothetical protein